MGEADCYYPHIPASERKLRDWAWVKDLPGVRHQVKKGAELSRSSLPSYSSSLLNIQAKGPGFDF